MIKRHLWKIIASLAVLIVSIISLIPIKDRDFVTYAKESASHDKAGFHALVAKAEALQKSDPDNNKSTFVALRRLAKNDNIDLNQYFGFRVSPGSLESQNSDVLDELLKRAKSKMQLGLDLKGGTAFTLELDKKHTAGLSDFEKKAKLDKAMELISKRIDANGVTEPIIRSVGSDRLEVQLPGVNTKDNPDVMDSVKKPAKLSFHVVHMTATPENTPVTPVGYTRMTLNERDNNRSQDLYIETEPRANGAIIANSKVVGNQYGKPEISLNFTSEGRAQFYAITKAIVDEHARLNLPRTMPGRLAIVLDDQLQSAPTVKEAIAGNASISGDFSIKSAESLASALNNPLDVPFTIQAQYEVGPSLAEDAVSSGIRATLIGAGLVALFMIVFYSSGGLLAVIMLGINVLIIFGVMSQMGATLSLPGIAGIVLTMGMAVDANILIFERMREELAAGKSLAAANQAGFSKALWTILDAHFVQLLICGVMIIFGTGPIKGFGVTLAIGVCSTLFSVLITGHMLLEMLIDGGWLKKITMRHLLRHAPHWDFVKWGKYAFISSWAIVIIGVGVVAYTGKAIYGIDFAGGDSITLKFDQTHKVDIGQIRVAATNSGVGEIHPTYTKDAGKDTESLRIQTATEKAEQLLGVLQQKFPASHFEKDSIEKVGAVIGDEILWNAIYAVAIAMLVTLLYIAFRFEFGFGVGAMFSSLHDILMTIGLFVIIGHTIFGFQFSAPMVAAILAIAGYSINETVVVFDRIREELRVNQGGTLRDIVNTAINKVFARTIMTSTTTLLAAVALFAFGSGVLKEISFTFLVGIITSTFSAIFISSQVFYWYHKGDRKHVEKHQDVKPTYEWTGASKASE